MNIFLDDIRVPRDAYNYTKDYRYINLDWIIVRSYDEFTNYILNNGIPELISFDHDLSDEHYGRDDQPWSTDGAVDYFSYNEKTGYDCAKWLCNHILETNSKFPDILIHSWNKVGSENIRQYIKNFIKYNT